MKQVKKPYIANVFIITGKNQRLLVIIQHERFFFEISERNSVEAVKKLPKNEKKLVTALECGGKR